MTTVRDATFSFMRASGMTTVFGNPGSTELRFLRDWPVDFRYVPSLHEGCVVAMADAYAQLTRNAAFANLHSAGGVGNAMGSIFSAFKNQTPLVITAGQQTRAMLPNVPFLYAQDATTLPKPYVKSSVEPARAEDVPEAIAYAYRLAMEPPLGPTFVSIPEDDWDRACPEVAARTIDARFSASSAAIDLVARALGRARRPALVVGAGVDRDDANDAVRRLAERTNAPTFVAPFSSRCSFPERHPQFAGFLPPVAAQIGAALADFDLVLVLGAPVFTYHVFTDGAPFAAGAEVIQLVDDPAAAASAAFGTSILATLRETVEAIVERLPPHGAAAHPSHARRPPAPLASTPGSALTGALALESIARTMPRDAIVVEEAPSHRGALHDRLPIDEPGTFFAAASGSLGWGLPAAVGAALARPGRRVVAILGDGSSMYAIQGLWTARRYELPITFAILNNRAYAAMDQFGRYLGFTGTPSFDLAGLDFVRAAETFGCSGVRVTGRPDLETALAAGFADPLPSLVEIVLDESGGAIY